MTDEKNPKIAVVVPSIREEQLRLWKAAWEPLLEKHNVFLYTINDGDNPEVACRIYGKGWSGDSGSVMWVLNEYPERLRKLIVNRNPAVRNIGFYQAIRNGADIIMTFDDDCLPVGDTIQDHLDALNMKVNKYWMNTATEGPFMRGYPYGDRYETQVVVSHGVWTNHPDLDAPTQLLLGENVPPITFYKGVVPNGVFMPFCGMNVAFRREAAHMMYWAPAKMLKGAERFDDIWCGIYMVREMRAHAYNYAWVSGYATVNHTRLSNIYENLKKEAYGIQIHDMVVHGASRDSLPEDVQQFFNDYEHMRAEWLDIITEMTW